MSFFLVFEQRLYLNSLTRVGKNMRVEGAIHRLAKLWRQRGLLKRSFRERTRAEANKPRFPLNKVQGVACELLRQLRDLHPVEHGSIAGSLRRGTETVGDIDLVVASKEPQQASNAFLSLPWKSLRLHSADKLETKVFTLTYDDIPVDLWIVHPDVYGVALFTRTGSTAYLMKIYKLALDRTCGANWSHDVQEHYAAFLKGDSRFRTRAQMKLFLRLVNPGGTEMDVYKALNLPWVEPALRV